MRGERSKTKRSSALKNAEIATKAADKATGSGAAAPAAATAITSPSKTKMFKKSIAKQTKKIKSRKSSDGVHVENKLSKNPITSTMAKVKSSKSKSSKAKEIMNYMNHSSVDEDKMNSFGKVQQWLLDSPTQATSALQELDQLDKSRPMCKSQSQTHNLSTTQRSPKKVKSLSNLQEKVKLQVVYKPPFKLSLKLSTNSAVQTRAVNPNPAEVSRTRRTARMDKNRKISGSSEKKKPRTALLLQTKPKTKSKSGRDETDLGFRLKSNHHRTEDKQQLMPAERKQDTLELKAEQSGANGGRCAINEEKSAFGKLFESSALNTDTFKISKTSSGTKLLSNSINALNEIDNPPSLHIGDPKPIGHRNSFINNLRNNSTDYGNFPLNRSSTSNLTKDLHKITRSSTTNLSKNHSHRNSLDVKQNFDVNRSCSTHNFSKDILKQPQHARSSKNNLNASENGSLPSSAGSSTSSTNANVNASADTNPNVNAFDRGD